MLVHDLGGEGDHLFPGECVNVPPHRIHFLGDLLGGAGGGSLENRVLDEMADAIHLAGLRPRAALHPNVHRHCSHVGHLFRQDGQSIESRLFGEYILPDEGKITSAPTVDIMEIYQLNCDVLDRAQDTARQEIELEEDKRGLRLLDRASQATNTVSTFSSMSLSVLENLRFQVERHRLIVDKFLVNRAEVTDIQINMSGSVDPVTQREWNLAGYVGRFLGAHILTAAGTGSQEVVPAGTLYAVTSPEYLGEMGIRVELFSEPFNKFPLMETVKGWMFVEVVGYGIPNSRSVAKALKQ